MNLKNHTLYLNALLTEQIAKKTQATALFEINLNSSNPDTIQLLQQNLSDLYVADAKINILKRMLEIKSKNEN